MGNKLQQSVPSPVLNKDNPQLDTSAGFDAKGEVKQAEQLTKPNSTPEKKPACKACCACPETKAVRDKCIMENGEENCKELIEAHKECMRKMGFKI